MSEEYEVTVKVRVVGERGHRIIATGRAEASLKKLFVSLATLLGFALSIAAREHLDSLLPAVRRTKDLMPSRKIRTLRAMACPDCTGAIQATPCLTCHTTRTVCEDCRKAPDDCRCGLER